MNAILRCSSGLLVFAVAACAAAAGSAATDARGRLTLERFRPESEPYSSYSGLTDSSRIVISDNATWSRYWSLVHQPIIPTPPLPAVDFRRERVILASMGRQSSGGYSVLIHSAEEDSTALRVTIRTTRPGAGCAVTAAMTQPVDIVRVPLPRRPVTFSEETDTSDCRRGRNDP